MKSLSRRGFVSRASVDEGSEEEVRRRWVDLKKTVSRLGRRGHKREKTGKRFEEPVVNRGGRRGGEDFVIPQSQV